MKHAYFFIFLSVFFTLWAGANYYVYHRGMQAMPAIPWLRMGYTLLFIFLAIAYLLVRFIEQHYPDSAILHILAWAGSFWLAGLLYAFLAVLLIDLFRLVNHFIPFFPAWIIKNPASIKIYLLCGVSGMVLLLLAGGFINARSPVTNRLTIDIPKSSGIPQVRIAMASDIHFGMMVGKKELGKMVRMMEAQKPDIILLAGDLMDELQKPVIREDIGSPLHSLKAPLGVYAITGNHEYIGGVETAVRYIESLGIKELRDTAIDIHSCFWLAGREDRDIKNFNGKQRKSLKEILKPVDFSKPVIVMDHQPVGLQEAVDNHVDLQLSGHTHHGQFWPVTLLTKAIYEVSRGYLRKGNTRFYVSNGFGTWGPPVRIGNRPEIRIIDLHFQ